MLECSLIYEEARHFWKFYFDGKISVAFDDFARDLSQHLNVDIESENNQVRKKCLEAILCKEDDKSKSKFVALERFGYVLKWFGPLTFRGENIIEKIESILKNKWFHGEVSREQLSVYNTQFSDSDKKKSRYLVRFSESEPIEEHPFSITVWNGGASTNYRVNYDVQTGEYSVSFKEKKESVTVSVDKDLGILVNHKLKGLKLKNDIVSKFQRLFAEKSDTSAETVYIGN